MARNISLQLQIYGKHGKAGFKVDSATAWILKQHGWISVKQGAHYHYLQPPIGTAGGSSVSISVDVPDDADVLQLAEQLHKLGRPHQGTMGKWPVDYTPAHHTTTRVETKELNISGRETPIANDVVKHTEQAMCIVGLRRHWHVSVIWGSDGKPQLRREREQPAVAEPPSLFPE